MDTINGIEGENDFSGKRYVWLKDPQTAFVKGWIADELGGNRILVQCDDGTVSWRQFRELIAALANMIAPIAAGGGRRNRRQGQPGEVRQS